VAYTPALLYNSPTQVNFEIPAGIAIGAALVTVGGQSAAVQIATVAPGLFTLNTAGLAAADAIRIGPGNTQTAVPVFTEQNGGYVATPISLSPSTEPVYLVLYGTGIRGAGNNVTVTIGGVNAPVAYAGPQGQYAALDQVNVLVPPQLAGSGMVSIVLTAAGVSTNAVHIAIQ
jgi:uncharacterized protein (TIGR03437 family)